MKNNKLFKGIKLIFEKSINSILSVKIIVLYIIFQIHGPPISPVNMPLILTHVFL